VSRTPGHFAAVDAIVAALDAGEEPARDLLRDAVRALLTELSDRAPGRSVEVRVPPYGAIQCIAGPRHTRGTPPSVIEMDPLTWVKLATGRLTWIDARQMATVTASGNRTDISPLLPLWRDGDS
jgi:hypothetical protein